MAFRITSKFSFFYSPHKDIIHVGLKTRCLIVDFGGGSRRLIGLPPEPQHHSRSDLSPFLEGVETKAGDLDHQVIILDLAKEPPPCSARGSFPAGFSLLCSGQGTVEPSSVRGPAFPSGSMPSQVGSVSAESQFAHCETSKSRSPILPSTRSPLTVARRRLGSPHFRGSPRLRMGPNKIIDSRRIDVPAPLQGLSDPNRREVPGVVPHRERT